MGYSSYQIEQTLLFIFSAEHVVSYTSFSGMKQGVHRVVNKTSLFHNTEN